MPMQGSGLGSKMPMTGHDGMRMYSRRDMVMSAMGRCTNEKVIFEKNP
jgi:hypothetical protein